MDEVMKVETVMPNLSKNEYLDFYKQSLVKSGNVDHIVPFMHSQK